jgi:ribosomal protein S21
MAIRIKSRHGEPVSQMLRRFKKLCEKEGLTKDIKRKQYYEKPSERRRRAARKAESRMTRLRPMGRPGEASRPGAAPDRRGGPGGRGPGGRGPGGRGPGGRGPGGGGFGGRRS